jgi:short-subunit dehydrogenase
MYYYGVYLGDGQTSWMRIDGKVVLITGASSGIGAACARAFTERGARVILTARNAALLAQQAPGAPAITADLEQPSERACLAGAALACYGRVDILVNNAGAGAYTPCWNTEPEIAQRLFELNFFAALDLIRLLVPGMRARREGFLVNVGSIGGLVPMPWSGLYSASKYALGALTGCLRVELRRDGIRAMTVCPGYVTTGFQSHSLAGAASVGVVRARRFAISPETCAHAIVRGVERNARTLAVPRAGWLLIALRRIVPSLVDARMEQMLFSESRS